LLQLEGVSSAIEGVHLQRVAWTRADGCHLEASIETDPSQGFRDTYGRYQAYIWLPDDRNLGEVMIGDG
jgi:endonuclease YncB( thermonuclease family)